MRQNFKIKKMVLTSILLAIIVILQLFASVVKLGQFQISLVLIPITIGSIISGPKIGGFLGFIFGVIVIVSGDALFFMSYNAIATIFIVLIKGTLAGVISGITYNIIKNKNIACILASFVTPIVNTLVFAVGVLIFLYDGVLYLSDGNNGVMFLFQFMIGVNFIIELIITIILATTIKRIIDISNKQLEL